MKRNDAWMRVVGKNGTVEFNPAGRFIWELLAENRCLEDLVSAMMDRFQIGADQAGADVRAFVDDLLRRGWIDP